MWALLLPLAKKTIGNLIQRDEVRKYLVEVLRSLAATDNKLDDKAVDVVESLLFQKEECFANKFIVTSSTRSTMAIFGKIDAATSQIT